MECRRGLGWSAKQVPLLNQRREWVQDTMSGSLSLARRSSAALASYLHDSIRGSRVEPSRRVELCCRSFPSRSHNQVTARRRNYPSRGTQSAQPLIMENGMRAWKLGRSRYRPRQAADKRRHSDVGRHNLCWIGCGRIPNVSCDTGPQKRKNSTHTQRYA